MSPAAAPWRVRRLGPGDDDAFEAMLSLFGAAFDEPETYGGARPGPAYRAQRLADDTFVAFVAEDAAGTVGALAAYELRKFEQERSEFYIYDLAVAVAHRRRGIATGLIEALRRHAATRGGSVIFVQADHGDDPAIALYQSLGSREDVLHFDIPVPRQDGTR